MSNSAYIIAAIRTAVTPRNGELSSLQATELGAHVIESLIERSRIRPSDIDTVVMGNALYGGGNPARVAALAAGLPVSTSAMTIDTQCCAGLDAIITASMLIQSGAARAVIAGGMESFSRSPIRQHRPLSKDQQPVEYQRPPFTPWRDRDPDMLESAADLAKQRGVSRREQEAFAINSHHSALHLESTGIPEILAINGVRRDSFTRTLSQQLCARAPLLTEDSETGLTSTTVAVEADAAAAVMVVDKSIMDMLAPSDKALEIITGCSVGSDPVIPSLAPLAAMSKLFREAGVNPGDIHCAEMMEAFAVQAMVCISDAGLDPAVVNRGGGALARGHPIGASGAILAVRLWHELQQHSGGSFGLMSIAAAGGLGSALLCRVVQQ